MAAMSRHCGYPIRMCEMLATLDGAGLRRAGVASTTSRNISEAKKAIKKAFQNQMEGKGFSIVEVLSTCPTNWGMTPHEALKWLRGKDDPLLPAGRVQGQGGENE